MVVRYLDSQPRPNAAIRCLYRYQTLEAIWYMRTFEVTCYRNGTSRVVGFTSTAGAVPVHVMHVCPCARPLEALRRAFGCEEVVCLSGPAFARKYRRLRCPTL